MINILKIQTKRITGGTTNPVNNNVEEVHNFDDKTINNTGTEVETSDQ